MLNIGLTGNAGSGKSTAIDFFSAKGISGVSADAINTELRHRCKFLATTLDRIFHARLSDENGILDPARLRHIIFSSRSSLKLLEGLLHPIILQNIDLQLAILPENKYCIIEIPLLFEADLLSCVDSVLLITADRTELIRRLRSRNNLTQNDAEAILDNQLIDIDKYPQSNDIVLNNNTQEVFHSHLNRLHHRYS